MTRESIIEQLRDESKETREDIATELKEDVESDVGDLMHRLEMLEWAIGLLSVPRDIERMDGDAEEVLAVLDEILFEKLSDYRGYSDEEIIEDEGGMAMAISEIAGAIRTIKEECGVEG